jgi:hypothetical protein
VVAAAVGAVQIVDGADPRRVWSGVSRSFPNERIMVDNSTGSTQPNPAPGSPPAKRKLPIASLVILAGVGLIVWLSSTYYRFFFSGPVPADDARLLADAAKVDQGGLIDYVRVDDRKLMASGYQEENTTNGTITSTNPYWLLPVDDKLMLVMTESNADLQHLVGPISPISMKSTIEIREMLLEKHPELKDRLLPVMLNAAAAYNVIGYIGLVVLPLVTLLCLLNIAWRLLRG